MSEVFAKTDCLGTLYMKEVFFYFEEPQLFSCTNKSGQQYLSLLTDLDDKQWLLLPISESKLALLKINRVSVYDAFKEPEDGYIWHLRDDKETNLLQVNHMLPERITDDQLPDRDVYLDYTGDPLLPATNDNILEFAAKEGRDIVDVSFSKEAHIREISCETLGAALSTIQHLLYSLSYAGEAGRLPADIREKNRMTAVGFRAASFCVRLKSNNTASFFNETSASQTLMELATLLNVKDKEEQLRNFLRNHSKKATIHYNNLMELLNKEDMALKVDIATPSKYASIDFTKKEISNIVNLLNKEIEGSREEITVRGTIIGIHTTKRTFSFISLDDEEIFGKIDQRLKGFTFKLPKDVEAEMERQLEVNEISGKEKYKYTLISLKYDDEGE